MRTTHKSKFIAIALFSGLMLSLAASPAKAGDLSIGIGFNLGHPYGYHNSYYPDSYVIHYRDYDRHRHHYYHDKHYYKHWKHHKKHWKHHGYKDRHYGHRGHYDKHRYHSGKRADYRDHRGYRDHRRHDRHDGAIRHYRH